MMCPVGGHEVFHQKYVVNDFGIMMCPKCQHGFTDLTITQNEVGKIFSDDYFFGGKDGYPDYRLNEKLLIKQGEKYAKLLSGYTQPGLLLDVGTATGFLMKGFQNANWKVIGIEPNAKIAEYGIKNLQLDIRIGTLEESSLTQSFDLILLIQVISHLFDLNKSMNFISERTKEGGYVLVETWNKNSFSARLFGESWHQFSPPSTLNYFSKKSLDILMKRYGFTRIARGRASKIISGKHARSLLQYSFEKSKKLKWLKGIEKVIPTKAKIPYLADDLFWALYIKDHRNHE